MEKRIIEYGPIIEQTLDSYSTTNVPSVAAVINAADDYAKRHTANTFYAPQKVLGSNNNELSTLDESTLNISNYNGNANYSISGITFYDTNVGKSTSITADALGQIIIDAEQIKVTKEPIEPNGIATKKYVDSIGNAFTFTPITIRQAVLAGNFTQGELDGIQPANSTSSMRFCDANYKYEYMNGMNDTDGTLFVWVRVYKT